MACLPSQWACLPQCSLGQEPDLGQRAPLLSSVQRRLTRKPRQRPWQPRSSATAPRGSSPQPHPAVEHNLRPRRRGDRTVAPGACELGPWCRQLRGAADSPGPFLCTSCLPSQAEGLSETSLNYGAQPVAPPDQGTLPVTSSSSRARVLPA